MRAPLTILHLASEVNAAGSTVSIALLARAQRQAGHRVLVGCPAGSALAARAAAAGLELVPLALDHARSDAVTVAELARRRDVDVVNAHAHGDRAACRRARFGGRLPQAMVMTRRVMPRSSIPSAVASGLAADRVIAVSRSVARALRRRGTPPGRIRVVPNAVDWQRIERVPDAAAAARARALAGWTPGRPTIGVVARRKDQDDVVRALLRLRLPVSLCCLGIAADDGLEALAGQAVSAGHGVTFVPFQDDVRPFYAVFDVAVLPSATEGCSQALLEAMALGVPVVATDAGGNRDVVRHGEHGLLAGRGPGPLAAAIARLLLDAGLRERVKQAARRRVLAEFDIAKTAAATEAVYREALDRRAARAGA